MESVRPRETRITALMVLCLLAGVALGIATTTIIFPRAPTELSRTAVLFHALRDRSDVPPIVVLGDSIVMNGIDAHRLGDGRSAWNFASVSQNLAESLLLADSLPPAVHTVVVGITIQGLLVPNTTIAPNKYAGYVMSGYTASPEVHAIARRLDDGKLDELLGTSRIRVVMWSRWVVRAMADLTARRILRKDIDLERSRNDLHHPAAYTHPMNASALERLVATEFRNYRDRFVLNRGTVTLLKGLDQMATARGKHVMFVVLPEHPRRRSSSSAEFYAGFAKWVNEARAESLDIVDLHDVLEAGDFIDHLHPAGSGTSRLTQLVDLNLRRGRS